MEVIKLPSEKPFIALVVDENLLQRIDNYRFDNRFQSRAAAIKHLIELGLKQEQR